MWKWIVVAVMALHGAAHLVGVMGSLLGREMEGTSGRPTIDVGRLERGFAVLWLLALIAFAVASLALAFDQGWWRVAGAAAVTVSMIPIIVWWDDAWRGAIFNGLVLAAIAAAPYLRGLTPD